MGNKAKAAVMEEIVLINIFFSSSLFNVNALKPSHHAMRGGTIPQYDRSGKFPK